MMQSEVHFGTNITPLRVTAPGDSHKLIISNLPLDIAPHEVDNLTRADGILMSSHRVGENAEAATVQVEFINPIAAYRAFRRLQGHMFRDMILSVTIMARATPIAKFVGQKLYIEVTYPRPYRSGWAHYKSVNIAKQQAVDLNNIILNGRLIKASYVTPKKGAKNQPPAVHFENLSAETSRADIEGITEETMLITMDPPIIEDDPTERIKNAFGEFGDLEQFDLMPPTTGTTSTAFISFKTETQALEAMKELRARALPYIAKRIPGLRGVHYTRYCISRQLFKLVESDLAALQRQWDGSNDGCTVQCNDHPDGRSTWIRLFAKFNDQFEFASANTELRRLLSATKLMSEGKTIWDDYFEIPSGTKALEQIQLKLTSTLIICDKKARCILFYGSKEGQTQAQAAVLKLLSKVHAQLTHQIGLARPKLNPLVNGGFATLQSTVGPNKVALDTIKSLLIVRGSVEDVAKVETIISSLRIGAVKEPTNDGTCQICYHEATQSVTISCNHAYCTACLQSMLFQKGSSPFKCIYLRTSVNGQVLRDCTGRLQANTLKDLPSDTKSRVLKATFLSHVRARPDEFFFCPSMDCEAVHRVREEGVNITCTACAAELCTFCKSLAHIGIACPIAI